MKEKEGHLLHRVQSRGVAQALKFGEGDKLPEDSKFKSMIQEAKAVKGPKRNTFNMYQHVQCVFLCRETRDWGMETWHMFK